jgi:hypothetical protein
MGDGLVMRPKFPQVRLDPQALVGGLDIVSTPLQAQPGSLRYSINYEWLYTGGAERVRGIERFSGQPRPSDATYSLSVPATTYSGVVVGDTVVGDSSAVTGEVIYVVAGYIALTKMTGSFTAGETLKVGGVSIGVHASEDPAIDGFIDNTLSAAAANVYRADIAQTPGGGPIRGVAILSGTVYAWRDDDDVSPTAMVIWKSTSTGWVAVSMFYQVSFTAGSSAYAESSTLTQGSVNAVVRRVALETGTWTGGTAAGRLIIEAPTGGTGHFVSGAAAGGGACNLSAPEAIIALLPGGRVETDAHNFTASLLTTRLYGCDGVNPEFEFDGTIYVPLNCGMTPVRASFVRVHKNQVIYAFRGSIQNSAIGLPYQWSAITGSAEIGTGDTITGMEIVGGSEADAAMIVFCLNSLFVLYGNDVSDWRLAPLSNDAGATPYSTCDVGRPMSHDTPGFRIVLPQRYYGNFSWDIESRRIEPIARQQTTACSVFSKALSRYRCFFADGSAVSATPYVDQGITYYAWMPLDYGRNIVVACSAEIDGVTRTFYGDSDGWVTEADVGRSFDGDNIVASFRMSSLFQKSPATVKSYRRIELQAEGFSAFTLRVSAEFDNGDPNVEPTTYDTAGAEMVYDQNNWDQALWDVGTLAPYRMGVPGDATCIAPMVSSDSAVELSHQIQAVMVHFTPRRIGR